MFGRYALESFLEKAHLLGVHASLPASFPRVRYSAICCHVVRSFVFVQVEARFKVIWADHGEQSTNWRCCGWEAWTRSFQAGETEVGGWRRTGMSPPADALTEVESCRNPPIDGHANSPLRKSDKVVENVGGRATLVKLSGTLRDNGNSRNDPAERPATARSAFLTESRSAKLLHRQSYREWKRTPARVLEGNCSEGYMREFGKATSANFRL